jgi:plasmid stabilization system protein ParE
MNYVVKTLTSAETDTVEAALWYDAQLPGLGAEFLEETNKAVARLATAPEIHRIRFADVRRAPIHGFKYYGLFYLVQDAEVWIIAVFHGRRHPRWLIRRRKQIS